MLLKFRLIYNHLRQEAESKCGEFLRGEILNTNPGIGHDPPDFEQIPVTSELDKNIKEIEKIIRREEQNRCGKYFITVACRLHNL